MHDIVFVSMEDWDEIWRRNQFVCAELARRHPDMRILFLGVQRNVWRHIKSGQWRALFNDPLWQVSGFANIHVTRALRIAPERYGWGRKFNDGLISRHLRKAIGRVGIRRFVLWLNPHYAVHLAGKLGESTIVYDITDDWSRLSQEKEIADLIVEQDRQLCSRADAVIVCSERLRLLKEGMARHLHLIPNGVDSAHYASVLDDKKPVAKSSGPVLGYTGTLHPDRVDVELIRALAQSPAVGSVVLVGPNHLEESDLDRLRLANIVIREPVPYSRIPQVMREFDVCITPHRVTPFTESLNPIKLWEYLAAGKPIVSTNVAGFRDYPELVRIAETPEAFVEAVRAAMHEPADMPEKRRTEARRHSWSSRVDAIEEVIESCLHNGDSARG